VAIFLAVFAHWPVSLRKSFSSQHAGLRLFRVGRVDICCVHVDEVHRATDSYEVDVSWPFAT